MRRFYVNFWRFVSAEVTFQYQIALLITCTLACKHDNDKYLGLAK